jgi:phosphoserine phosphatase
MGLLLTKLHIFDMDGTLLQGSACLHISEYAGCIDQVNLIEEAWGRGEVGHVEFYRLCLPMWAGLDDSGIDAVFDSSPWIGNVAKVFSDIAARGEYSAVITLSPLFFVQRLLRWGLTTAHGAHVSPGEPPDPARVLTPASKVEISAGLMKQYGLAHADCVAYGDSASDLPLFQSLPNTVGVNASSRIAALSKKHYQGDDLWAAYQLGRALIEPAPPNHLEK